MLPAKDYAFLKYIEENCKNADYVFKGDDDILVVPYNLANLVNVSFSYLSKSIKLFRIWPKLAELQQAVKNRQIT